MYNTSQREVGEYSDRMHLEVGTKLFRGYPEHQCRLLEKGILGFCLVQRLAVMPQKYLRIFIIILLYIPGINKTKLRFFQEFVKCYMIVWLNVN